MRYAEPAMELYQLRTFLVIARTGNLTRAARELHTSQPAVSAQLKALEDELGVLLFTRSRRGMKLTAPGERLVHKAQEVSDRATELTVLAASLAGNAATTCTGGLNTTAEVLRVSQLLTVLAKTTPELRLDLHQGLTHTILADVARGELDAGFFFGPCTHAAVESCLLAELDLAIVGPSAWKSALTRQPLERVLTLPWVWPPAECSFYGKAQQLLRPLGAWPANGVTADDEATVLHLVRAQVGIALLPAFMAESAGIAALRRVKSKIELGFAWQRARSEAAHVRPVLLAVGALWRVDSLSVPAIESP